MYVGALSTSRIDKGDSSGFPSDVATASLGLFIKIQDYIDSLVLIDIYIYKPRASSSHVTIARAHEAGLNLIIISFGFFYRLFNFSKSSPIIQNFIRE